MSDLIAKQPELAKGVDQALELLNFLTADGGAEKLAKGMKAMSSLADCPRDPNGPLLQTLDQLPALIAAISQQSLAAVPGARDAGRPGAGVRRRPGRRRGGAGGQSLADLQATLVADPHARPSSSRRW